ncbi:hypothetical protein ACOWMK_06600 [Helicobacter pylori]
MNASVKGLLALLLKIQTNKGVRPFILNFHNPRNEDLVSSLVKAFLN